MSYLLIYYNVADPTNFIARNKFQLLKIVIVQLFFGRNSLQ